MFHVSIHLTRRSEGIPGRGGFGVFICSCVPLKSVGAGASAATDEVGALPLCKQMHLCYLQGAETGITVNPVGLCSCS